jgi:hypothetical protein
MGRKGQNVQAQNVASPSKLSPGQSPGLYFIALRNGSIELASSQGSKGKPGYLQLRAPSFLENKGRSEPCFC